MTGIARHQGRAAWKSIAFVLGVGIGIGILGLAAAGLASSVDRSPTASAGRIPEAASAADGSLDVSMAPDLIAVEDEAQVVVGYAKREDLFGTSQDRPRSPEEAVSWPSQNTKTVSVWDESGTVLRGHLFADVGYMSLAEQAENGVSPESPPRPISPPTTTVDSEADGGR